MFNRLHTKIVLILLSLLIVFGVTSQFINQYTTQTCLKEVHQKLNQDLAKNLAVEWYKSVGKGIVSANVDEVFKSVLSANPNIKIFVLDAGGEIVSSSTHLQTLKQDRVSLRPINEFLSGTSAFPIYGDDPLSEVDKCLFSVAPISDGFDTVGYLYVMLDRNDENSIVRLLGESPVFWTSLVSASGGLVLIVILGAVLVKRSTRKLRDLSLGLEKFKDSKFTLPGAIEIDEKAKTTDEITHLQKVSREMAETITRQLNDLELASEFRRELITNVSHDLRTPLASLQGYIESAIIKSETLSPEKRNEYLTIALNNCKKLTDIIEELHDVTQMDAGRYFLRRDPLDLVEILKEVIERRKVQASDKGVELDSRQFPAKCIVLGDPRLLKRALKNIAINVINHSRSGSGISIELSLTSSEAELMFADPSRVIPEEELGKMFNKFFRKDGNPEVQEAGVGITLAHRIVELHGGSITVTSSEGPGTIFKIVLPKETV